MLWKAAWDYIFECNVFLSSSNGVSCIDAACTFFFSFHKCISSWSGNVVWGADLLLFSTDWWPWERVWELEESHKDSQQLEISVQPLNSKNCISSFETCQDKHCKRYVFSFSQELKIYLSPTPPPQPSPKNINTADIISVKKKSVSAAACDVGIAARNADGWFTVAKTLITLAH